MAETSAYDSPVYAEQSASGSNATAIETGDIPARDKKKIIKEGRMGIRVGDLHKAKANVVSLTDKYGGYLSKDSYNDSDYSASYTLTIRIPNQNYEAFVAEVESGDGKVEYKEINARDVSEEYYDIETRLANKRAYLARYQELVKRAGTIKEVLEVEEQVRKLEEEIESAEGRLRYLGDQVSYSTLNLSLTQPRPYAPVPKDTFWGRLKNSVVIGWHIIIEILLVFVKLWPILIIGGTVLFIWLRRRKKRKAVRQGQ